jgi:penicillin-binding protein 1A
VFDQQVGETAQELLAGVVRGGTGKAAQIGEFAGGKTGTTENYGDAWFVGFNKELTVAVWVGYPDRLRQMKTEYHGGPVAGGTFPTEIWHDLMTGWIRIRDQRDLADGKDDEQPQPVAPGGTTAPAAPATGPTTAPARPEQERAAPETQDGDGQGPGAPPEPQQAPATPPAPAPQPPPPAGGGGGAAAGPG